jgi:hypothetical protein
MASLVIADLRGFGRGVTLLGQEIRRLFGRCCA